MSKSRVLFGITFRRCSPGDQLQLVRQAVDEMEHCLCYPELNDVRSIKRRIRYIIRKAREFGIEVE
jgi:hypothetical protein